MKSAMKYWLKFWMSTLAAVALLTVFVAAQSSYQTPPPPYGKHKRLKPKLQLSPAPAPYHLASPCDLQHPVLTLFLQVRNVGDAPSSRTRIIAIDKSLAPAWEIQTSLPTLAAGESATVNILVAAYSPPAAMAGSHIFRFTVENLQAGPAPELRVAIPPGFCGAALKPGAKK
jgi:hypothetical protein